MGVTVIGTHDEAALTCNTTGRAFGPVHRARVGIATDELRDFVSHLDTDARVLHANGALESAYREWAEGL